MTNDKLSIVAFLDPGLPCAPALLEKTVQNSAFDIKRVYLRQHKKSKLSVLLKTIQQSGLRYTIDRSIGLLKLSKTSSSSEHLLTADELCQKYSLPHRSIHNCNQPDVIDEVRRDAVDLILTPLFTQIVKSDLRAAPKLGCINIHPSLLPQFQGTNPVYWALVENVAETGLTLHLLDEGIDTGPIVAQAKVSILPTDTHHALYRRIVFQGAELLEATLLKVYLDRAIICYTQPPSKQTPYPPPTPESYKLFKESGRSFI